jgi:hypothetical protein
MCSNSHIKLHMNWGESQEISDFPWVSNGLLHSMGFTTFCTFQHHRRFLIIQLYSRDSWVVEQNGLSTENVALVQNNPQYGELKHLCQIQIFSISDESWKNHSLWSWLLLMRLKVFYIFVWMFPIFYSLIY